MATVDELLVRIDATTESLRRELKRADKEVVGFARKTDRHLDGINRSFDKLNALTFAQFAGTLGVLTSALSADRVREYSDAWKGLEAQLRNNARVTGDLSGVQEKLYSISQSSRTSLRGTTELFADLSLATRDLGTSQKENLELTELLGKTIAVSGKSAEQGAAAIQQLGQALASGTLQGDELRSLRENAPRLAVALADGLGVATGALKEMGSQGQLTAEKVVKALLSQKSVIETEFNNIELTVGQAMTKVDNAFLRYIGTSDKVKSTSGLIAGALSDMAENFDEVADATILLATVIGGTFLARALGPMIQQAGSAATGMIAMARAEGVAAAEARNLAASQLAAAQAAARMPVAVGSGTTAIFAQQAATRQLTMAHANYQAVLARTALSARVASVAMKGLNSTMAFLGGPVGLAILGVSGAMYLLATRTDDAAAAAERHEEVLSRVTSITEQLATASGSRAADLREERDALLEKAKAEVAAAQASLEASRRFKEQASSVPGRFPVDIEINNQEANLEKALANLKKLQAAVAETEQKTDSDAQEKRAKKIEDVVKALHNEAEQLERTALGKRVFLELQKAGIDFDHREAESIHKAVMALHEKKDAIEKAAEAEKKKQELETKGDALKASLLTAEERFNAEMREHKELLDAKAIDHETYSRAVKKSEEALKEAKIAASEMSQVWRETGQAVSAAGEEIIFSAKSAREALSGLLEDVGRIIYRRTTGKMIESLFDSVLPFANGGVMTAQGAVPLRKYASGGIATSPQLALYGEGSRPEAYVPLPDGRTIPVTMQGGGGGMSAVFHTTINLPNAQTGANGLDPASQAAIQRQIDMMMKQSFSQNLRQAQRPGGQLNPMGNY